MHLRLDVSLDMSHASLRYVSTILHVTCLDDTSQKDLSYGCEGGIRYGCEGGIRYGCEGFFRYECEGFFDMGVRVFFDMDAKVT